MYRMIVLFFVYSFLGWLFEVVRTAFEKKQYINKGFLNTCFCPSYGIAMVLTMMILEPFYENVLYVFLGATMVAITVEFSCSVFLEKVTGSRWWDYSNRRFQFEGRISMPISLLRGAVGTAGFYFNHEIIEHFEKITPPGWLNVVWGFLGVFLVIDCGFALYTAMSMQSDMPLPIRIGRKMKYMLKKFGHKVMEETHIRIRWREIQKESAAIRRYYKKDRERRRKEWLQQRMILAAPELAPDEKTLERLERKQRNRKKKLFRRIMLNRVLFTALFLLIQVFWLFILLTRFAAMSSQLTLVMTLLSLIISLFVYSKRENSAYRLSWILVIMAMPLFGGLLYLFFGNKNPSRQMRTEIEKVHKVLKKNGYFGQKEEVLKEIRQKDARVGGRCHYLYKATDAPVWKNTETTYYPLGDDMFEDMLEDLKKAEHFIFMEFFIVEDGIFWGSILEVLKEKARAGVDVRVMYDDVGCLTVLPESYTRQLEDEGISCIAFNPFKPILSLAMNNRDHRKILVIDGHTAYTGGVNLADEYINMSERFGKWKDTAMRFYGEAVLNFTMLFLEMWNSIRETDDNYEAFLPNRYHPEPFAGEGYVQPFGDTPLDDDPTAENLYIDILNEAKDYVYIYTPYLIISDVMQHALCLAASRGVDVKIMTPGIPDKKLVFRMTRSNYRELLKAGIQIYEYTPGFLHAKSYVSDDKHAVIGTINMDYRSLYLHFECGAYLYETPTVLDMKKDFLTTMERCRKMDLKYMGQGLFRRMFDSLLALFSPLV